MIAFEGLSDGETTFSYEIGADFFDMFEGSPVHEADVFIHLTFDKKPSLFVLSFFVDGSVHTDCDRCAESFELPLQGKHRLVVKMNEEELESSDPDVIFIRHSDHMLNIAQYIYEYINLSMPLQKTCDMSVDQKVCNPEVLKRLGLEQETGSDPRWEKLKGLNTQTS